ncbi:MAG: MAPEG family protein [Deltaproteobacteria bacterium]|nr:MAG: MAPEG family protein [Deltaproteobacteria bacterium]
MKLELYNMTLIALTTLSVWILVLQFVAATAKNVIAKGTPGVPIATGHDDFNFRAERAHANTLDNVLPFAIVVALAIAAGVSPWWTNTLSLVFLGARIAHTAVYYADLRPVRTLCFFLGFLTNFALGVMTLIKLF